MCHTSSRLNLSFGSLAWTLLSFFTWLGFCLRCDAEPGALADYILALLKHYVVESELRLELGKQLEEFLEKGTFLIRGSLPYI